ncbi:ricin-type beta-trefoil lectin domain protein [Streptomyces sp. RKAG293]|uniref:RICIN domain-containing protein n=1 Tax=Streptomyces sp. RKAG293 TaxID=2893403 RepID=UPI00203387C2|nr:ricin-type beta-trefoil lectin domain protein [Streptomyces sp. RKAG293]MCM2416813.1 ricin-type beta-trefoil lectin domain protein [Streptomyces sp. RKAG293]
MSAARIARRCAVVAAGVGMAVAAPLSASASVGGGNVSTSWSIPDVPSAGMTNLTFPMTVNAPTDHHYGIYMAEQYNFTNQRDVGYTGLQPQPNNGGTEQLRAVFSNFITGSSTNDPNCHSGADGGDGVSCGVVFNAVYGHQYNIKVAQTGTDTWSGTVTDGVTGTATHIGTYILPTGSGKLRGSQGGFLEYYAGVPSCATMPRADVVYGAPTSTDGSGLSGTARAEYEYSDCVGSANYQAVNVGNGVHVTRGWIPGGGGGGTGLGLVSSASGRCLDDPGSSTTNGTQTVIWDCNGAANQKWAATAGKALTAVGGKCLDAAGTSAGSKVDINTCNGSTAQQWTLNANGSITGTQSGLCLDVTGAATANGSPVGLWNCTGSSNQKWARN